MKNKKLFLPALIMALALLVMTVYCFCTCIAQKPTVTSAEFPFSITYEYNGEEITYEDVFYARYSENGGYSHSKLRIYVGEIGKLGEGETFLTVKEDETGSILISTKMYPDYMMGDPWYDYFDDEDFAPELLYHNREGEEFTDEETLTAQGVKLISWEYPEPIENSFKFSHLSHLNGEVVLPALIISLVALLATIIFVKKERKYTQLDIASIVFNVAVMLVPAPFLTIVACFVDVVGGNDDLLALCFYFLPAFTVLGVAASIALRRKGYSKVGFFIQFVTSAVLAILMLVANLGLY